LFLAHKPKRRNIFLAQFSQGQRTEIAPLHGGGFGCHKNKHLLLISGNCIIEFDERYSFIYIHDDYQNIRKLALMLKQRGLWCGSSRTISDWRKLLIDAL
jgi:hypothetical protein